MKFLSKLAQIFAKGLQLVGVFAPIVQAVVPGSSQTVQVVSQDLGAIAQAVVDAEQVGVALQLKGADKLKVATPKVADVLLQSSILVNHKVADPALFSQGVTAVASGMADVINSLQTDNIQVVNKQA